MQGGPLVVKLARSGAICAAALWEDQTSLDYGLAELVGDTVAAGRQPDHLARFRVQFGQVHRRQEAPGQLIPRAGPLPSMDFAVPSRPVPVPIALLVSSGAGLSRGPPGSAGLMVDKPPFPFSELRVNPINEGVDRRIHFSSRGLRLHRLAVHRANHFRFMLKLLHP